MKICRRSKFHRRIIFAVCFITVFIAVFFAVIGLLGYARARRAGLTCSKCYLRDTRLVLAYLGLVAAAATAAILLRAWEWWGTLVS